MNKRRARRPGFLARVKRAIQYAWSGGAAEYKGATMSRLVADWVSSSSSSPDDIVKASGRTLRARSRDLERNNAYVRQYLNLVAVNVIGPTGIGIDAVARTKNGELDTVANEKIEAAWKAWAEGPVTLDGRRDLVGLQRLLVRAVARDGEVFVRFWRGEYGLRLEALDADLIDDQYSVVSSDPAVNEIRMGVEIDRKTGAPVAFYVWNSMESYLRRVRTRVPATEMIQIVDAERIHQTRGVPWCASVMELLKVLDGYIEAELVAARAGASKMGFFVRKDGGLAGETPTDDAVMEANAGSIEYAPDGFEFQGWDPDHPTAAFSEFTKAILRAIASGLGVSYPSLTGDLADVNYSSMRSGLLIERDLWRTLQGFWVASFCRRVFSEWLDMSMLTGALDLGNDPRPYRNAVKWTPRGWAWVDPLKDTQATVLGIQWGLASRTSALREQGVDVEELMEEIADETSLAETKDIEVAVAAPAPVAASGDGADAGGGGEDGEASDAGRANGNGSAHPALNRVGALVNGRR